MKKNRLTIPVLFLTSLLLLALAFVSEQIDYRSWDARNDIARLQKVVHSKEKVARQFINKITEQLQSGESLQNIQNGLLRQNLFQAKGMVFLIYSNDSLCLWTDNCIPIGARFSASGLNQPVVKLKSYWIYPISQTEGKYQVVCLTLLKTEFEKTNSFIHNHFEKSFDIARQWKISAIESANINSFPIYNNNGKYIFNLIKPVNFPKNIPLSYISLMLYIFSFILFIILFKRLIKHNVIQQKRNILIIVFSIIAFRVVTLYFEIPKPIYALPIFEPSIFASSIINPTLGDLLINSALILIVVSIFCRYFNFPELKKITPYRVNLSGTGSAILIILAFYGIFKVITSLVLDSSIVFETYKVLQLSIFSITGYFIILFLLTSFVMLVDKVFTWLKSYIRLKILIFLHILTSSLFFIVLLWFRNEDLQWVCTFYLTLIIIIAFIRYKRKFYYSWIMAIMLVFALFTVQVIHSVSSEKEHNSRKVKAISLATEHDPVAELLLVDVDKKIRKDTTIIRLLNTEKIYIDELFQYVRDNYFAGYWNRYDLQVTFCNPADSVFLANPDSRWEYCYGFFKNLIRVYGIKLPGCNFYYLNNSAGRISYFRELRFNNLYLGSGARLFLELDSKLVAEQLGYPELLLDRKTSRLLKTPDYNYAKYKNNQLTAKSGSFPYSLNRDVYGRLGNEFEWFKTEGFSHLIYNIDAQTSIILSCPTTRWIDLLISFSYVFVFFYLVTTISLLVLNRYSQVFSFTLTIKNKIQFSIIGVLVLTFILIGAITILFQMNQNTLQQHQLIREKLQSVMVELDQKIGSDVKINSVPVEYLNNLLIKLSNVFYTDINVFDLEGILYATSRNELFDKGLTSTLMNPVAYQEMIINSKASLIHSENIGLMSYYSSYVPLVNSFGNIIAIINLPYFSKQAELKNQISGFVVTVINIYALLIIIAIIVAVVIANKLTKPLRLIQLNLEKIKIGEKNQNIDYFSDDEIGNLIHVYNRMVVQLTHSAELLAQSERESAWREMARQIAHEIKNPLTPMKLSVQLLEKSWKNKDTDFENRLKKVTQTLIEQIDTLSAIASEFGDFAKMPRSRYEAVDVVERIYTCAALFDEDPDRIHILINHPRHEAVMVNADYEQLLRVFNNLMKNAIQAIPDHKPGQILVDIIKDLQFVTLYIADNGTGIHEDMADKLFQPNFTTKTSGMGLGLAIVKTIIDELGGSITFETKKNKGTTFIVKLPLYFEKSYEN